MNTLKVKFKSKIKELVCINKVIYVPNASFTMRELLDFALQNYEGGTRYYEVVLNGVFLARIAIPKDLLKESIMLNDDSYDTE